jgi:6-hydroxycyclohex-1-ene-1-carbonyl-CoA dehydrogenase
MKAAVFHGDGRGVAVEEWPTPSPGAGEALVKVAACGVCHTDLHYVDHGTPTFKKPPIVLGHEVAGTVIGLEAGGRGVAEGDRVLIPAVLSCGRCRSCREGRENICERGQMLGNHVDGGYAEYVTVPADQLVPLPDQIPLVEGAVIADALTTPYHAVVHRGRVRPGDWVAVIGCGGVGLNLIQMATAVGAQVVAVDVDRRKLEWARRLGAVTTLEPAAVDRVDKEIRRFTGGGADVAFEAVGKPETQKLALECLRTGGRAVLVGYSPGEMSLNSGRVMFRELEIMGSLGCRPVDYPRVVELVREGRIRLTELVTHRFPLEQIDRAFDTLRSGDAIRSVVIP